MSHNNQVLANPFQNEADVVILDDLMIENRVDRVVIYGSCLITFDKVGLARAQMLYENLRSIIACMDNADLPDNVSVETPVKKPSPLD